MKLYAQQGYGIGSGDDNKIAVGLHEGFIQGAILSPKDCGHERIITELEIIKATSGTADRLFDPQFYACFMANEPDARMGKLISEDYAYFGARRRSELESENRIADDLRQCLLFQKGLDVTGIIAPNIVIRRRLDSIESVISKNFIRQATGIWEEEGDSRPLYATLAIDAEALQDKFELEAFLEDITIFEHRPNGFYLLIGNPASDIAPELIDPRTLAGWMLLNHTLQLNGFEVINGFSDILTPFLCAAGGSAGATGWFNTQKVFSLDRFSPPTFGGRRPVMRYLSKALLNSIRFDELQRLRGIFPAILNGLSMDAAYPESEGSEPNSQLVEILQTWEAISSFSFGDTYSALNYLNNLIQQGASLYQQIDFSPAARLSGRSNNKHLEALAGGIQLFAELAEIDL